MRGIFGAAAFSRLARIFERRVGGRREAGEGNDVGALLCYGLGEVLRLHLRVTGIEQPHPVAMRRSTGARVWIPRGGKAITLMRPSSDRDLLSSSGSSWQKFSSLTYTMKTCIRTILRYQGTEEN